MLCVRYVGAGLYVKGFTLLASSAYLLAGVLAGGMRSGRGRLCLLGLVFCWIGDVIGPGSFVAGLYAFLFAHVAFSVSFLIQRPDWRRTAFAVVPLGVVTLITGALLWPAVQPEEHMPFIFYSAVISVMVILATGISAIDRLAFAAALIFYISDILVARWRYAESAIDGYLCYMLYYTSCLMFAYSARPVSREAVDTTS